MRVHRRVPYFDYAEFLMRFLQAPSKPRAYAYGQWRRAVKRARKLSRPTENIGAVRAAAHELLVRYRQSGLVSWLEEYARIVPSGYTFDSDFGTEVVVNVDTSKGRPTERRGCVSCGGRYEEKSFWHGVKQSNGTVQLVKSWYCEVCRERQRGRKWYDVMADDASGQPQGVRFRVVKGRDNVRGARVRGA